MTEGLENKCMLLHFVVILVLTHTFANNSHPFGIISLIFKCIKLRFNEKDLLALL